MAQSDWDFFNTAELVGGPSGHARLHSTLSSPLVDEGLYCRSIKGLDSEATHKALLKDPKYIGIPTNVAVSMRAWFRVGGSNRTATAGFLARGNSSATGVRTPSSWFHRVWPGYGLVFNAGDKRLLLVRCFDTGVSIIASSSQVLGSWIRLRFDVIPVASGSDILRAYRSVSGSTGSEDWLLLYDVVVSGDTPLYQPATEGDRYGYQMSSDPPSDSTAFIDRFQIFTEEL